MAWARAALALAAVVAAGLVVVSGGSSVDPRTPPALPGEAAPFLGTAVAGSGGLTASVDAYGNVVDLLAPGPAGEELVDNPSTRQAAGSVAADTGIRPRVRIGGGRALPMWEADAMRQRYLPGTNVVRTVADFGAARVVVTVAATKASLAVRVASRGEADAVSSLAVNVEDGVRCRRERHPAQLDLLCRVGRAVPDGATARREAKERGLGAAVSDLLRDAARADRRWLDRARPLGASAPRWASAMYERSLLAMRALTDRRSGAVAAGARDGWSYAWPRDAGAATLAFAAAGYRAEARRVARFLTGLDLAAAARFDGRGRPVPGRAAQGDAAGWVAVAARAAGVAHPTRTARLPWRDRADYREGDRGDYLGNAIAASSAAPGPPRAGSATPPAERDDAQRIAAGFGTARGLARRESDAGSGLDSAAAWAVRPFALPALYPAAERTLQALAAARTRYGVTPGEDWRGGADPWSAPTAWTAWGLAALSREADAADARRRARADRRAALGLLTALRRAATPAGALPERVDLRTGVPRSTTPLAWSHAFAALALLELWPPDLSSSRGGEAGNVR